MAFIKTLIIILPFFHIGYCKPFYSFDFANDFGKWTNNQNSHDRTRDDNYANQVYGYSNWWQDILSPNRIDNDWWQGKENDDHSFNDWLADDNGNWWDDININWSNNIPGNDWLSNTNKNSNDDGWTRNTGNYWDDVIGDWLNGNENNNNDTKKDDNDWWSGNNNDWWHISNGVNNVIGDLFNGINNDDSGESDDWWSNIDNDWWHTANGDDQWDKEEDGWWSSNGTIKEGNHTIYWSFHIFGMGSDSSNGSGENQTNGSEGMTSSAAPTEINNALNVTSTTEYNGGISNVTTNTDDSTTETSASVGFNVTSPNPETSTTVVTGSNTIIFAGSSITTRRKK